MLLKKLLPRLRRYLGMNVVILMRRALAGEARACAPAEVECRPLSEAEALAFAADPQLELSEQWIHDAYARGCICLGALARGELLGYTWLAFGDTPYEEDLWIRFDERLRYTHKSFVRPECRGRRIMQALQALADRPELRRSRHFAVAFVNADNHASLAAFERSGSRRIGFIAYLKCFGAVLAFRSPGAKRTGVTFYNALHVR
jgi:GNAT superfamily N-acetyltransferase